MSRRDEDDGILDDSEEEEERPKKRKKTDATKNAKNAKNRSFIDDAAEESGDEVDDEDDDDDDEDNNDYVKDGFVVDEDDVEKKKRDDLEDSDDEEDEEDDDDGGKKRAESDSPRKRLVKVRKMRQIDRLDEEDLALIQEAQEGDGARPQRGPEPAERERVVARTEDELRRGLFTDQAEDDDEPQQRGRKPQRVDHYDEYDDGFIEDDIGDQGDILASERRGALFDDENREVSEAQLNEASEIFGTDYLEFMADEKPDRDEEDLMGRGGVGDYNADSEEDISDDDLFDDDDDDAADGATSQQKKEALRLKREKRQLEKAERRRQALQKKTERRKAQLRRAFEPVQLVENFCTDRDDSIRQTDLPERFYDWKTPFYGSEEEGINQDEREQAEWIVGRIHPIASEFAAAGDNTNKKEQVLQSIANALRFMHRDKLEPSFLKHYRKDYITSTAVRENIHSLIDEDTEWDRMIGARTKVETLFQEITMEVASDVSKGADAEKLQKLQEELEATQEKLDDTVKQETQVKHELEALGAAEDDDDELFGDDDDEEVRWVRCILAAGTLAFISLSF
jgi:transcription elongation factor SPT6